MEIWHLFVFFFSEKLRYKYILLSTRNYSLTSMFLLSRISRFPRGQYCFHDALSVHSSFSRPKKNYTSKANALLKPNTTDLSTPQLDTHSRQSSSVPKLVSLIQNAARVVEEQYTVAARSSGETERLVIPSLDDTQIHPLDDQMMTPAMRSAVQTLEATCAQLTATVAKPHHTLINVSFRIIPFHLFN